MLSLKSNYFNIRAPFYGVLSETTVNKGALINVGQSLGTLIDPSVYEMEVKINPSELDLISIGKTVQLFSGDKSKSWKAKVTRINRILDPQSQSAIVIVEVRGKDLREGMFLQANISTVELQDVVSIPRSLLVDEKFVYTIKDSMLRKKEVALKHIGDKNAYVEGLAQGDVILQKTVSGAYDGMKVNPLKLNE